MKKIIIISLVLVIFLSAKSFAAMVYDLDIEDSNKYTSEQVCVLLNSFPQSVENISKHTSIYLYGTSCPLNDYFSLKFGRPFVAAATASGNTIKIYKTSNIASEYFLKCILLHELGHSLGHKKIYGTNLRNDSDWEWGTEDFAETFRKMFMGKTSRENLKKDFPNKYYKMSGKILINDILSNN